MGDRCYYRATVHKANLIEFTHHLLVDSGVEWECEDEDGDWVHVSHGEMNYGGMDGTFEAAKAGCIFEGYHWEGAEYGPEVFVGIGNQLYPCPSDHEYYPVVRCLDEGHMDHKGQEIADAYWNAYWRFKELKDGS